MEKIDSRTLSVEALNERRRRAVKMRLQGVRLKETAAQCEMSRTTVIAAVKAYEAGGVGLRWTSSARAARAA